MTIHNDAQSRPVDPADATSPMDEIFPPPPKRSAPPPVATHSEAPPPAAPALDVRATFDSLQLVNSIRDAVVRDIVDKDSARLADALSVRLAPQLRDQIKTGVSAEFADRAKVFGAIAGVGGLVLGFVGYQSLASSLEVSTKQAAQEAAVAAAESEVKRRSDGVVADMRSMRDGLVDQVKRDRELIDRSLATAQQVAVDAMLRVTDHANVTSRDFNKQIQESTKQLIGEARVAAVAEVDRAKLDLRTEYERSQAAIARLAAEKSAEIKSAGDIFKTQVSSLRAQQAGGAPASASETRPSSEPDDVRRQERMERAMQLDAERRFDLQSMLDVAGRFEDSRDSRGYRSVFDPVYNFPSGYTAAERQQVAALLTADWIPPQERRSTAIELLIAALRSEDPEMFALAERVYDSNLYTVNQPVDPFIAFVKLAFRERGSAEARAQFGRVDPKSLTLRGRLNFAYIGKAVGEVSGAESVLHDAIDELFVKDGDVAYIDRYTDYTSAAHVLDVLLRAPVVEKERVIVAVQRIKGLIFKSDNDPDPFELRKRIDEFLGS